MCFRESQETFLLFPFRVSLMLFSLVVCSKLGCKWTMAASLVTYMPYIAAQFHATFYTLVPAGILVGLGAATLWVAKATYLSLATQPFSEASGLPVDVLTVRFSGIFFAIFAWAQIFGNIISSTGKYY